jgi:hypothetical protein
VTSPDQPETDDVPADSGREERAVATASPAVESEQTASGTNGTKNTNGSSAAKPTGGATPAKQAGGSTPPAGKPAPPAPKPAAAPATSKPSAAKPTAVTPASAPATPVASTPETAKPPARAADPESAKTVIMEGPEVTSSAPPPWQRVASDAQHLTDDKASGDGSASPSEKTTRFSEWGYQRSPRSDSYTASSADKADALAGGVVSGTASPSVFAATAGQSGVRPDARPSSDPTGRTTVNFGAPPPSATRPAASTPTPTPSALRRPGRGPRRASLQVRRVDPWSVLKLAFVLSVALFFVWLVAVGVLYGVLDGMGVWDRVNGTYNEFAQGSGTGSSGPLITASRVFGIAAIIGAINIVLFTALATVGSFVYNVSADLAGGLEITLAERE